MGVDWAKANKKNETDDDIQKEEEADGFGDFDEAIKKEEVLDEQAKKDSDSKIEDDDGFDDFEEPIQLKEEHKPMMIEEDQE